MIVLAYHDTCPFPTPVSPRYHISSAWERAARKFPGAIALPRREWDGMVQDRIVQNETGKTSLLKTAGAYFTAFQG